MILDFSGNGNGIGSFPFPVMSLAPGNYFLFSFFFSSYLYVVSNLFEYSSQKYFSLFKIATVRILLMAWFDIFKSIAQQDVYRHVWTERGGGRFAILPDRLLLKSSYLFPKIQSTFSIAKFPIQSQMAEIRRSAMLWPNCMRMQYTGRHPNYQSSSTWTRFECQLRLVRQQRPQPNVYSMCPRRLLDCRTRPLLVLTSSRMSTISIGVLDSRPKNRTWSLAAGNQ